MWFLLSLAILLGSALIFVSLWQNIPVLLLIGFLIIVGSVIRGLQPRGGEEAREVSHH